METSLVAAILGGGAGVRMGGRKALVLLDGKPLAEHVAGALRVAAGKVAMVGDAEAAHATGAVALFDPPGFPIGPMSGICVALEWAAKENAELLMVAPCDAPLLKAKVVEELRAALTSDPGAKVACAETADGLQPLISMWRAELAPWLRVKLGDGHPAVRDVLKMAGLARVRISDVDVCLNVNTPEDLGRAEAILHARR